MPWNWSAVKVTATWMTLQRPVLLYGNEGYLHLRNAGSVFATGLSFLQGVEGMPCTVRFGCGRISPYACRFMVGLLSLFSFIGFLSFRILFLFGLLYCCPPGYMYPGGPYHPGYISDVLSTFETKIP